MGKQKKPKAKKRHELDRLCDWLQFRGIRAVIVEEEVERRGFLRRLGRGGPRRFIKLEGWNIDTIELRSVGGQALTGTSQGGPIP